LKIENWKLKRKKGSKFERLACFVLVWLSANSQLLTGCSKSVFMALGLVSLPPSRRAKNQNCVRVVNHIGLIALPKPNEVKEIPHRSKDDEGGRDHEVIIWCEKNSDWRKKKKPDRAKRFLLPFFRFFFFPFDFKTVIWVWAWKSDHHMFFSGLLLALEVLLVFTLWTNQPSFPCTQCIGNVAKLASENCGVFPSSLLRSPRVIGETREGQLKKEGKKRSSYESFSNQLVGKR